MGKDDRACSLILLSIGIAACLGASQHEVGTFNNPGPGLFPMVLGAVLGVLSLMILFGSSLAGRTLIQGTETSGWHKIFSKQALFVISALVGYGFLLIPLGFIATTFLVFCILLKFLAAQKWPMALGGALFLSFGAYVIFDTLLGVPLPPGILGI
jgi:putative tricarboxylic transport membrane protein